MSDATWLEGQAGRRVLVHTTAQGGGRSVAGILQRVDRDVLVLDDGPLGGTTVVPRDQVAMVQVGVEGLEVGS